jgi:hypothetical protein
MVISKQEWKEAQEAEKGFHNYDMAEGLRLYGYSYSNHFKYLDIPEDLGGKTIIEIGCAGFPALYFRKNYKGVVVEPLEIETLETICKEKGIERIKSPVEEIDLPECDEIWLFNVMQHIIDPELFVTKCKAAAKLIRYFEPVDYPTCVYHPHTFSVDDFKRWFGEPKIYEDFVPHFHDAKCVYGNYNVSR